jgi:Zn-dependent M16 (insulinase) family peptidase
MPRFGVCRADAALSFSGVNMNTYGFVLAREELLRELSGTARLWRHAATGAQLLSIRNRDENKCFGVTFRTPPPDSSGVAHILEHSVLCGSERFPVREPFVELLKGSLQTFLNAFTFPDKTCYPVAGTNLQDFYNLVDVYLDAVFHPRISEDVFRQEGWHVEAEENAPWSFKGVVYNEMKGVYSSPEAVLGEQSQWAVFPDTVYGLDSGGAPESILRLTYEDFTKFHATYYHPSNARFFFWGDDPEERRLKVLGTELARFEAVRVRSEIALQPRLAAPRFVTCAYAAGENDARAMFTLNWLLCGSNETDEVLALEILEHILLGLPGSPLRRALIESGLGEDVAGAGLETDLRQLYFSVGLKGMDAAAHGEVEKLIINTLETLAREGIAAEATEAAVNSVEFARRENNIGRFPRGLAAMLRSLTMWLYDGDPLAPLRYEAPLASCKRRLARGERLFEDLIRRHFLENAHRAGVLLVPDAELAARREADERARLDALRDACSPEQRQSLISATRELKALQATPDSPEALASIPGLQLADLPTRNALIPCEERRAGGELLLFHDLDTSGVVYVELLLPLGPVPASLLPLLPLFARALTEMGTTQRDFSRLGMSIASKTGGLEASPLFSATLLHDGALAFLSVAGKATEEKSDELFDLLHEILLEPDFTREERFRHMLLEEKNRLEQSLIPSGHAFVSSRLQARWHDAAHLAELTGGIAYLDALRALTEDLDARLPRCLHELRLLHTLSVRREGVLLNLTTSRAAAERVQKAAERLVAALPADSRAPFAMPRSFSPLPPAEAFCLPAQVNYVGKAMNCFAAGYRYHGSVAVILRHLRMGYLWERVRVQGGAYGAFCSLDRLTGALLFLSYRDPGLERTFAIYDEAAAYLKKLRLGSRELTRAVVGAAGELDTYLLPDAKGCASMMRRLTGMTDALRQQLRDEIFSTRLEDFHDFADILDCLGKNGQVCAMGGNALERHAREHGWAMKKIL